MTHTTYGCVIIAAFLLSAGANSLRADEPTDLVRASVERGLTVLERGAREYPSHESCFSCHHQTLPLLAMTSARNAGLRFDEQLLQEQIKFTCDSFQERKERLGRGEHVGGRAATVSYGLWTLFLGERPSDDLGAAMASYLLKTQLADGSWKPPSNRPPLEASTVSCTVLSAIGIKRYATEAQQEDVSAALDRARNWLAQATLPDQEDLNFAFWAESLLNGDVKRKATLCNRILAARRADGGWSQISTLQSDAYATGQTLFVLIDSGLAPDEAPVREAVALLLETQESDGSWRVATRSRPIQPWFDNGDPHGKDQFISIAATGWATAALARSLPLSPKQQPIESSGSP